MNKEIKDYTTCFGPLDGKEEYYTCSECGSKHIVTIPLKGSKCLYGCEECGNDVIRDSIGYRVYSVIDGKIENYEEVYFGEKDDDE